MTEWEQILANMPSVAPFEIPMHANSDNEIWADIHTKLDQNHGWHIRGLSYTIELVDPTVPIAVYTALDQCRVLQLHRGSEQETLLPAFHPDCLAHVHEGIVFNTSGLDTPRLHPIHVPIDAVTRHQTLRILFRTEIDVGVISDASVQLTGIVLYDLITAPDDGRTKLGIPIDEI